MTLVILEYTMSKCPVCGSDPLSLRPVIDMSAQDENNRAVGYIEVTCAQGHDYKIEAVIVENYK